MEEALLALILADAGVTAISGDRFTWSQRVQGEALPAGVLHRITGRPDYHLQGTSGLEDILVQIDCWGSTYTQAKTLARAVKAQLSGYRDATFSGLFIENERDSFEQGDGAPGAAPSDFYRTSLDIRVWFRATAS